MLAYPRFNFDAIRRAVLGEAVTESLNTDTRAVVARIKGHTVHAEGRMSRNASALVKAFGGDYTMPGAISEDVRAIIRALQYGVRETNVSFAALQVIDAIL
jgi:hypothetical protein